MSIDPAFESKAFSDYSIELIDRAESLRVEKLSSLTEREGRIAASFAVLYMELFKLNARVRQLEGEVDQLRDTGGGR